MWSNKYIGIPFKDGGRDSNGLDCWGLVRLVYKDEFNINLPSFNTSYSTVDDTDRLQELINQYKEGWTQIEQPTEGSVALFKTMGSSTHVGVLINNQQFLHVNEGTNVTVENLTSYRWNKRILGYYSYTSEKSAILNAAPHPLRTQLYTLPVTPGTTLQEVSNWIFEKYQVTKTLAQKIIIIVNGRVIERDNWSGYLVQQQDRIEYRAIAGKGNGAAIFRLVAMIAIAFVAPYIAGAIQGAMAGGTFMSALTAQLAIGSPVLLGGFTGAALTAGITLAGGLLVNAIAPIRPPSVNTNDPGSAEQQLMATGAGNRAAPYDSIPIVLGKMIITPPLGAINYITYENERDTYLSLMLTWGYGPLVLIGSNPTNQAISPAAGLRIGELSASDYTVDAIEHINMYQLDNAGTSLLSIGGDETKFNTIYGSDVAQHFRNLELVNDTHPFAGSVGSPTAIEAAVAALSGTTPASERYNSVEIAVHFPQGLRKIKAQGNDAGKSYTLVDSANGGNYPLKVKYEWDIGSGWAPITSLTTSGEASGVVVYGTENKKDAFTKTHIIDLATPTTVGIKIRATRLTGGWTEAPQQGTAEYTTFTANSGQCYVKGIVTETYTDGETGASYTNTYEGENLDATITSREACNDVQGRFVTDSNGLIKQAEDWRFCHQVNLLSLTVRRNAKPTISPRDSTITKTAIRVKSSQELNGQLEGINAVVQTYGRDWKGGSSYTTINKAQWQFGAINNPASLLLHVLISPANPRQILWSEIENKVDLAKLQYWHYYCQQKGFQFNSIVAQQRSLLEVMKDICAAGRASPTLIDGKWTVVIDEPRTNIVQHFSPHNTWGFEGTRVLNKLPDGLRVTYYDEAENYKESEIILYNYGYNEDGTGGKNPAKLFETIQLPGITKKSLVEDHARWHMAQGRLRREVYSLNTDLEYIICNRGDRVTVAHDVPLWGAGSGRIKNRLDAKTYELDEAVLINPAKQYQIKVRSNSYPLENTIGTIVNTFTITSAARVDNIVTVVISNSYHSFTNGDILDITGCSDSSFNTTTAKVVEDTTLLGTNVFKYENVGPNASSTGGTITLTQGLYQKITLTSNIGTAPLNASINLADSGDLFLFGELNRISNDLVVLSIDPTNSKSAKLTLVDYGVYVDSITPANSYNIFNDYLTLTESQIFSTNITLPESLTSLQLTDIPTITNISSDIADAELISPGTYRYRIRVSYSNSSASLSKLIDEVECQYDLVGINDPERSIFVKYNVNTIYIPDVEQNKTYKVKLRYITRDGITGPWTSEVTHTVLGKTKNLDSVSFITAEQKGKFLEISPNINPIPVDFKHFEIRVWKNTNISTDWWDYSSNTANGLINSSGESAQPTLFKILKVTDKTLLDLTEFDTPRISETGITYTIACKSVDTADNYSKYAALTYVKIRTIQPPPFKVIPQSGSINIQVEAPVVNGKARDDVAGLKVWVYSTSTSAGSLTSGDLKYDSPALRTTISNLDVEKIHYYRFAVTSIIDPTVYTISSEYTHIPRAFLEDKTDDIPPDPAGIEAEGAITSIIVTLPTVTNLNPTPPAEPTQATDYGGGDYTSGSTLSLKASSRHKSTVVYGKVTNSLLDEPAFSAVQNNVLGEFEEKTVFTLPADPGTVYALFFKYRNRAGNLSANAFGPVMVETGVNVQKFLDMLADQITEGQLFKGLQSRLSRTDRMPQVDASVGQYTVKIDNGGHVAGFGLSNTSRKIQYGTDGKATKQLTDGRPFSEFGVVADRFWISGTAVQSDTEPTTDLYHGMRWIDTGSAGNNEGVIFGPLVYYNVYQPSVHNTVTFEDNGNYWYWELKTKTELDKLIFSGVTYVNKGTWIAGTTYAKNDYVFEKDSNVYYVCLLAHTPVLVSNFATKNPKKIGTFTGSGASFAVGKTLYLKGAERLPTGATELAAAGTNPTYKLNPDYNPLGTFYYITDVSGTEFTLSLKPKGEPVASGISALVKYYQITTKPNPAYNLDPTKGAIDTKAEIIDTQGFVNAPTSSMFPFVVETGTSAGIRPGVYMDSAMIRDASITNAKIANLAVDSAKIAYLEAGKITTGKLKADLIEAGAITIDNIDITSLRGKTTGTWTLAMPTLSTSEVSRTIDLPPGNYELILSSTFGRYDEFLGSDTFKEETAKVKCEITGVPGAEVEAIGYWKKTVDSTKLDIKIKDKKADITTQPTYTFSGGVTADIPPGPPGPPGPPAPPADGDGGGGGGCLLYGTPVLMHDNTIKNMEDLQVGDIIKSTIIEGLSTEEDGWKQYSTNLFNCSPTLVTVTGVRLDTFHSYYNINNNLLKITYEHPVLVRRGNEYSFIQVIDLIVNDFIYHEINGWIQVISKEFINELIQTVSIDTEFEDVYFANGILVHNSNLKN